jgi:glycerate-2-kinase
MVDGYTIRRAKELNIDVFRALYKHSTYEALIGLEDTIFTGSTGTNIQDLRLFYIID